MARFGFIVGLGFALVLGLTGASAAFQPSSPFGQEKVSFSASFSPEKAAPGQEAVLTITAKVVPGYHIYAISQPEGAIPLPTKIEFEDQGALELVGDLRETAPRKHSDELVGDYNYHEHRVEFSATFRVPKDASPGSIRVAGTIGTMACTWKFCDPPSSTSFSAQLEIEEGSSTPPLENTASVPGRPGGARPSIFSRREDLLGEKVTYSARFRPEQAAPGSTVRLEITAKIRTGHHIYGLVQPEGAIPLPTVIRVKESAGLEPGKFEESRVSVHEDEFTGKYTYHEGEVVFSTPVKIPKGTPDKTVEVSGEIDSTVCTWETCDPPKTHPFVAQLTVDQKAPLVGEEARPHGTESGGTSDSKADAAAGGAKPEEEEDGLLGLILLAVAAGFGALATPCVFPMIPITVSFFTKQAEEKGTSPLFLATAYALGIVISFTGFGLILAALKGATGAQEFASNPFVNLGIATIFIVFALNLFGLFELRIPTGLVNRMDSVGRGKTNLLAVMFMGFTFTLAAFTCTMPFMGAVLAQAASGEAMRPILGMLFFSGAFAFPFFLLALFPSLITSMRKKSGSWMHSVKVTMGFIELAAAFKFLSNADLIWELEILTRPVFLVAWVGIFGFCGLYLLGFFRMSDEAPVEGIGTLRMLCSLFFVSATLYLSTGLLGGSLVTVVEAYLPPPFYGGGGGVASVSAGEEEAGGASENDATPSSGVVKYAKLRWLEDFDEALSAAKKTGDKIFLNFTGDT